MSVSEEDFRAVMAGLAEAGQHARGEGDLSGFRAHVPKGVDVRAIRRRLGLSQLAFAERFGFTVGALRDWEQGRRVPEASARILLKLIDREPEAVLRVLSAA